MKSKFPFILLFLFVAPLYFIFTGGTILNIQKHTVNNSYPSLTVHKLMNTTYILDDDENVTLKDGKMGSILKDNYAAEIAKIKFGDLVKNKSQDAVVILELWNGGNRPYELVLIAVLNEHGKPKEIDHIKLDEVVVDSIDINIGLITVYGKFYNKDDSYCCPSKLDTLDIIFENNKLRYVE